MQLVTNNVGGMQVSAPSFSTGSGSALQQCVKIRFQVKFTALHSYLV